MIESPSWIRARLCGSSISCDLVFWRKVIVRSLLWKLAIICETIDASWLTGQATFAIDFVVLEFEDFARNDRVQVSAQVAQLDFECGLALSPLDTYCARKWL